MADLMPWALSALTIYMTVLAGNKHRLAWAVGLANQALWLVWIVASETWGLVPMNLALWAVYARNHVKWRAEPAPIGYDPFDLESVKDEQRETRSQR